MPALFTIEPQNPEQYRQQTRRSTLLIAVIFIALAMLLSSCAVLLFGTSGGDNFYLNVSGVVLAVVLSIALVRGVLWNKPLMAAAVYGWRLKRSLMRVTNVMHHVKAGVAARDRTAMQVLRFYHLGLTQMHQLDANSSSLSEAVAEINQHSERMQEAGLDLQQPSLYSEWLTELKQIPASRQ